MMGSGPDVRPTRGELGRYVLWQLPSWVLVALVAAWLALVLSLPVWAAAGSLALFVLKDLVLFPAMRGVFSPSPHRARPIGAVGRTIEPLAPAGYIRVNGELWKAEADGRARSIPADTDVIVRDGRGLTLIVDAMHEPRASPESRPGSRG